MKTTIKKRISIILASLINSGPRVPRSPEKFNSYIIRTDNHQLELQPGSTFYVFDRLGWSTQMSADWTAQRQNWETLYNVYIDPKKCTTETRKEVKKFISDFQPFSLPKLNIIVASATALDVDGDIFRIVLHRHDPTHMTTPLAYSITASLTSVGTGKFEVRAKTTQDTKRSAIPKGASHVEARYLVVSLNAQGGPELSPFPRAMSYPDDSFQSRLSTKAKFTLDVKAENSGKFVIVYVHWYVDTKPEFSSEYSAAYLVRIP